VPLTTSVDQIEKKLDDQQKTTVKGLTEVIDSHFEQGFGWIMSN